MNSTRLFYIILSVLIVTIIIVHIALIDRYCPHCIDHSWSASFAYDYFKFSIEDDRPFGAYSSNITFFGKTHAWFYGWLGEWFGWNPNTIRYYSTFLMVLSATCWLLISKKLTNNIIIGLIVFSFFIAFDPFFYSTTLSRPEPLVLLFISLITVASLYRYYLVSGVLVGVAFETHIMGISGLAFIIALMIANDDYRSFKKWLWLLVGGLLGIVYYLLLHTDILALTNMLVSRAKSGYGNSFLTYFFLTRYNRHLPELIVLIFLIYYIFRKKLHSKPEIKFSLITLLLLIIFSFLIPRGNIFYMIYSLAPICLLLASVIYHSKRAKLWFLIALVYYLPQHAYLLYINKNYSEQKYLSVIKEKLKQNPASLYVGHKIHWFAFEDDDKLKFYGVKNIKAPLENHDFIWIRDLYLEKINAQPSQKVLSLLKECPSKIVDSWSYNKRNLQLIQIDCKNV